MTLGGILIFMLAPFAASSDLPAQCSFAPHGTGAAQLTLTLEAKPPSLQRNRAVLAIDGDSLDARVQQNAATEARDVLIFGADGEGRKIVLALNASGQALLVREGAAGPAERRIGHCELEGTDMRSWFAG